MDSQAQISPKFYIHISNDYSTSLLGHIMGILTWPKQNHCHLPWLPFTSTKSDLLQHNLFSEDGITIYPVLQAKSPDVCKSPFFSSLMFHINSSLIPVLVYHFFYFLLILFPFPFYLIPLLLLTFLSFFSTGLVAK